MFLLRRPIWLIELRLHSHTASFHCTNNLTISWRKRPWNQSMHALQFMIQFSSTTSVLERGALEFLMKPQRHFNTIFWYWESAPLTSHSRPLKFANTPLLHCVLPWRMYGSVVRVVYSHVCSETTVRTFQRSRRKCPQRQLSSSSLVRLSSFRVNRLFIVAGLPASHCCGHFFTLSRKQRAVPYRKTMHWTGLEHRIRKTNNFNTWPLAERKTQETV